MTDLGLYIHAPFCERKCNYCDFYSFSAEGDTIDRYTQRVTDEIKRWGVRLVRPIDSVYLGGGTPSLLGGENIARILSAVGSAFKLNDPEITLECNPADDLEHTLAVAAKAGVNRISLGVQTGNEHELAMLGRRHTLDDVERTVADAKKAGIRNISMDIMLGLPHSTEQSVKKSLDFVLSFEPQHISVYMLSIEEGTPFYENTPPMIGEEATREQYLFVSRYLKERGYEHYEISNFAKNGYRSRHNMKYWNCDEYLGIGPSAHSFIDGRRFYYERDFEAFMKGAPVTPDGEGGDLSEYLMLRLRLSDGVSFEAAGARFCDFPEADIIKTARRLEGLNLVKVSPDGFCLTEQGFLVSNAVIGEFI